MCGQLRHSSRNSLIKIDTLGSRLERLRKGERRHLLRWFSKLSNRDNVYSITVEGLDFPLANTGVCEARVVKVVLTASVQIL